MNSSELINRQEFINAMLKEAEALNMNGLTEQSLGMRGAAAVAAGFPGAATSEPSCSLWRLTRNSRPEKSGSYLVSGKRGRVYINTYDYNFDRWYGGVVPVAWMTLPQPIMEDK